MRRTALAAAGLALGLALALSTAPAVFAAPKAAAAQEGDKKAPQEGPLTKYINLDANDANTKLEVIEQEVFQAEQQNVRLEFLLEYGDRVHMDFVMYPSGEELIPGYVFTAKNMGGGRHPAVVVVHGGFHVSLNTEWFPLIEGLTQRGYVVLFPEYRGSKGYGENLYRNDYGVTDTADVLAMADYGARKPFVDPNRLAILGESRGGMTALNAIEKSPTKFKAAIDVVGLTDFVAYMAYKPEYRREEVAKESEVFGGKLPNDNLAAYMAVSPINGVDKIQTPLLVMATTGDKIAPLTLHTGRLLDALKARGKVFESHIFEDAPGGHIFMHGDQPQRDEAYQRIYAWLEKYLK